jgi:hypothetical protein
MHQTKYGKIFVVRTSLLLRWLVTWLPAAPYLPSLFFLYPTHVAYKPVESKVCWLLAIIVVGSLLSLCWVGSHQALARL